MRLFRGTHGKSVANVVRALVAVQAGLGFGCAGAFEKAIGNRQAKAAAEIPGKEEGLVEPSLPPAHRVKGNRDDCAKWRPGEFRPDCRFHARRHERGIFLAKAVLEFLNDFSRNSQIRGCGSCRPEKRIPCGALAAGRAMPRRGIFTSAGWTQRQAQRRHGSLAFHANNVLLLDDPLFASATYPRKDEIRERARDSFESGSHAVISGSVLRYRGVSSPREIQAKRRRPC